MNKVAPSALRDADEREKDPGMLRPGPSKKSADEEQQFLAKVRKRFERCMSFEDDNRKAGKSDDEFYAGDQWPSGVAQERAADKRPMLTINKLPTLIHQVTNDYRQNPPAINVNPVGDRGDVEVAKMYRGLIRAIERDSAAQDALGPYNTAFESKARKGFGYWRLLTEYEDPKSFDQVIRIRRIRNAFTVYLDPDAQEATGSDARYGFITDLITRDQFKGDWPKADPMNWTQGGPGDAYKEWIKQENVRIAEYFEITEETRTLVCLTNGHVGWQDELSEANKKIPIAEPVSENKRESKVPKCTWYKLSAVQILEEVPWPGQWIPIVRDLGEEIDIDGRVKVWGIVRHAKDAQRMFNYWRSGETELVALAPKAPFIGVEGQFEGHPEWKTANVKAHPYLEYNMMDLKGKPAPPPQRQPYAGVPAGVVGAASNAAQDMLATTGIRFDATKNERMYDESGRALRELRKAGDLGNFHLMDNHAAALRLTGDMLIDLIPKVYHKPGRVVTILRENDNEERVTLDPNMDQAMKEERDPRTQRMMRFYNPSFGRYGVTTTIGPSYATKRVEAAESMMDFVRAMPQVAAAIPDLLAKNLDWPDADEIAARLAKTLPPNLLTPEQKDVPPQVQAVMQNLASQLQQATQQNQQLMQSLMSQEADRALKKEKQDQDFEAKLLGIVQKADAAHDTHIGSQLKDLAEGLRTLTESLINPPQANGRAQ